MADALLDAAQGISHGRPVLDPLSDEVVALLVSVQAAPRLAAHLRAVHAVAVELTAWLAQTYPTLSFDPEQVRFGAAVHDIGKALHPHELTGPGNAHESAGYEALLRLGLSPDRARFARTHNDWANNDATLEDLLVALADKVWKAHRDEDLERQVVEELATATGNDLWEIFAALDDELQHLADDADARLAFQSRFPT